MNTILVYKDSVKKNALANRLDGKITSIILTKLNFVLLPS